MTSPDQLAALRAEAASHALLDVRERAAYERGHIYGATSLPRRLLEFRLPQLVTAPATPIVVYDDDGTLVELARPTLAARIARGDDLVIVDARTPEEYARGCVPGAWSVPGGELVLRITDLAPRPDTTIVVHCGGGAP